MTTTIQAPPTGGVAPGSEAAPVARSNPALRGPVLLATDGASQSSAAVVMARRIADKLGVPLEVVTVLAPQIMYGAALGGVPMYVPELYDAARDRQLAEVRSYLERHIPDRPLPSITIRTGSVALEIAEVARERGATLIVMGAAPHQRLTRIVAGERAVQVLRASAVPVLSVPPGSTTLPRNVMVGVDFSPASIRAVQTALLFVAPGGTLTLVHVLSPLLADAPIRDVVGRDPANSVQMLFGRLRDEIRPYVPDDVTIATRVKTDVASGGILDAGEEIEADLLAVGTQGPRLLERLFVGSVASTVMHAAPQSVLAAPPPPSAQAMEMWMRITGTATSERPDDWSQALDGFTHRNEGRRVAIEVDDPEIGAQLLGRGPLRGVMYDPRDKRVEIIVGDAERVRGHLMHSIPNVDAVSMTVDEMGREALELRHGRGQTLVLFAP